MSKVLYRKYRPQRFEEIVGQKHIVQTLSNAVKNNRLGQAFLFTGPRGTGKTSLARILAKTINCQNLQGVQACGKCPSCESIASGRSLDIMEIDAASHTGVDNIRELIESVKLPPASLKFKIYIIDEVHMLSGGAFNALLKTLEEPPTHVIFVLATTEIHKVPETIISRCQRFDFSRLPIQKIIEKLSLIAKKEKVKIDRDSLETIAIAAEGGMRDAESLLGQIIALEDKNITRKEVEEILGTTDRRSAEELAEMILQGQTEKALEKINSLLAEGYDLEIFTQSFINYLRQLMLLKINPELQSCFSYEITREQLEKMVRQAQQTEVGKIILIIHLFLEAQANLNSFILPQLSLEIAVIKAVGKFPAFKVAFQKNLPPKNLEVELLAPNQSESAIPEKKNISGIEKSLEKASQEKPEDEEGFSEDLSLEKVKSVWKKLLEEIRPFNHSLKALLSNCTVFTIKESELTLATPYDFYKEKLSQSTNKLTVEKTLGKILGAKIKIKVVLFKEVGLNQSPTKETSSPKKQEGLLDSALEIMGGKIVEE